MKNVMIFCIPAHGHHNPLFPVAKELVSRGDAVRFYSFNEFKEKVEATGATFVGCDEYLAEVSDEIITGEETMSTTDMSIVDFERE